MKKTSNIAVFLSWFFLSFFYASCIGQNSAAPYIVPDKENETAHVKVPGVENIVETQDGFGDSSLPIWLSVYLNGGIGELEKNDILQNKYYFISRNVGSNLSALSKWANNYSSAYDFPRLVSARIEERMISAATLYPDDEYGIFFETLVKKSLGHEYPQAIKEDTYWIKTINNQNGDYSEAYEYFIVLSVEKTALKAHIMSLMEEALPLVKPTRAQYSAISYLQQIFFEGF